MTNRVLPPRSRPYRRLMRRNESGAALLEFAIVAIPFFLILYGLIAFGMMLAVKQSVTNASAEAARAAVGSADATAAIAMAKATVTQRLDWVSDYDANDPNQFAAVEVACTSGGASECLKVTVTYPYGTHPIVPPAPGLGVITPDQIKSESTVKYK